MATLGYETAVSQQTRDLLQREAVGQVHFSDVFPEAVSANSSKWWRQTDFDAGLTAHVESAGFSGIEKIPIGYRPWLATYGLVLVDDLVVDRNKRVERYEREGLDAHPDALRDLRESQGAVLALANYAPRDDEHTKDHQNGSDFYLAITGSGLEIYATPASFLSDLEAQDRITALYRIPTANHPEFNGEHEQFRSARVVRSRLHADHLVPIFEYDTRQEVREAKEAGKHPVAIPLDSSHGRIAYVDKFGNVKLHLADRSLALAENVGRELILRISGQNSQSAEFEVTVAEDLRSAPPDQLAVYANCSDHQDENVRGGLVELVSRVNDDPSTSEHTAFPQLLSQAKWINYVRGLEARLIAKK